MQTDIDMETNMDMDMGVKYVYIGAFGSRFKSINKVLEASKVTSGDVSNTSDVL
jgi:hypothetical protein